MAAYNDMDISILEVSMKKETYPMTETEFIPPCCRCCLMKNRKREESMYRPFDDDCDIRFPQKKFTRAEAIEIGNKLGVDFNKYDVEQFRMGLDVELEHGKRDPQTNVTNDDPILTGKIAYAHLKELPDYYTRLAKIEKIRIR